MRAGHELAGRTCAAVEVSLAAAKMDSNYDSVQYKILKEYSTQPIPRTSRPTLSSPHMWFLSVLLRRLLRGEGGGGWPVGLRRTERRKGRADADVASGNPFSPVSLTLRNSFVLGGGGVKGRAPLSLFYTPSWVENGSLATGRRTTRRIDSHCVLKLK